jgi:nucleoside-diphosphate-sugar epimerase
MLSLVTGATGLIGSHLVETLIVRGDRVRALVRPTSDVRRLRELGVELRIGNLMDNSTLAAAAQGVERIFHCAALMRDWGAAEDFDYANVQGVRNILAAATRAGVARFIYLSTTDIYGFPGRPVPESERPSPRGIPYADSKVEGEALVWNHYRRVGLPVTIIRPATVYGPRSQLLVVAMIQALRRHRLPLIDQGQHVVGLTYVGNLIDALMLAAEREESLGQAYNISDGSKVSWAEYLDALADAAHLPHASRNYSHDRAFMLATLWESYYRLLGRQERPPLTRLLVEWMGTDQDFPIAKAAQDLGYRPRVSFAEGLRHTVDWLNHSDLLG